MRRSAEEAGRPARTRPRSPSVSFLPPSLLTSHTLYQNFCGLSRRNKEPNAGDLGRPRLHSAADPAASRPPSQPLAQLKTFNIFSSFKNYLRQKNRRRINGRTIRHHSHPQMRRPLDTNAHTHRRRAHSAPASQSRRAIVTLNKGGERAAAAERDLAERRRLASARVTAEQKNNNARLHVEEERVHRHMCSMYITALSPIETASN